MIFTFFGKITQIKIEKIICNNIDLNDLNIPQVDNASLFVLENDDYNIKEKAKKMLGTDDKSWLVFNKYGESLTTDVYVSLDENDLDHIKLIHDLTNQTNKVIANVHTDSYFYGNVNQKLFLKCTIKNRYVLKSNFPLLNYFAILYLIKILQIKLKLK